MCGIAGLVSVVPDRMGPKALAVVAQMRDRMQHRGPDDTGLWQDPQPVADIAQQGSCTLGFRRLSIVDLAGGHQPMANEDGTVHIVFNGEIYNHLELRANLQAMGHKFATQADTEVLVHGWEQWGTGILQRCNGMFDLALWDGNTRQLLLARDRFGKKPLFVAPIDGGQTLVFGSELSAVRAHPGVSNAVDPRGLLSLLMLDYVVSPRSMLADVHTLQPGSFWLWSANHGQPTLVQGQWHAVTDPQPDPTRMGVLQALDELQARLVRAVDRRLMADVPLGIFLSGGIDSSLVAWAAAQLRKPGEIDTFAIGFDDKSFDEADHALAVARHLGTRHHVRTLTATQSLALVPELLAKLDQPLADPSIVPTYFLCQFARESVTVALGGDGGDEWLLGYPSFAGHRVARALDTLGANKLAGPLQAVVAKIPVSHKNWSMDYQAKRFAAGLGLTTAERHFAWIGGLPAARAHQLLHPDLQQALLAPDTSGGPARPDPVAQLQASWQDWRQHSRDDFDALAGLYARYYLADGVLQKVDRASMLCSLEARAPLLDPEFVAWARALPTSCKLRGWTTKWALRQLAADKLPASIIARPKKGFGVPLGPWLRGPLRPWLRDLLAPDRIQRQAMFAPDVVARMLAEHDAGTVDHRKALWALATFQTWHDRAGA